MWLSGPCRFRRRTVAYQMPFVCALSWLSRVSGGLFKLPLRDDEILETRREKMGSQKVTECNGRNPAFGRNSLLLNCLLQERGTG